MSKTNLNKVKEKALNYINENLERYISILKEVISYRSIASYEVDGVRNCVGYLSDLLKERGFKVFVKSSGGAPVLFGEVGSGSRTVLIYNHYDVQPPDPLELWASDPFKLEVRDNILIGRGVADNKGNIVARVGAVDSLLNYLDFLDLRIKFLIEGEEEVGSPTLADIIRDNLDWVKADGGIWESAYVGRDGRVEIPLGYKGMLYLELILRGANRDVHSGLAPLIPNPAWRIAKLLTHLKTEDGVILIPGFYDDIDLEFISNAEELVKHLNYEALEGMMYELGLKEFVGKLRGVDVLRELYMKPSLNISGLYSGYTGKGVKTIVPSLAGVKIDIRPLPGQDPKKILDLLTQYLRRLNYNDVEILVDSMYPAGYTKHGEEIVRASVRAAKDAYGVDPKLLPISSGSGPIYLFTDIAKIPMTGAGVGYYNSRVHAPNENIRMEDFLKGMKHVALTLINFSSNTY